MDDQAVILARGLGTRMRRLDPGTRLDAAQSVVADAGIKTLISVGRPFLDYLLGALAEAGYRRICLVIGPEHDAIRTHCRELAPRRIRIDFAVQHESRGTADAVAAAEAFAGNQPFIVLNSDNLYPVEALRMLREPPADGPALVAFDREAMLAGSNIPTQRLRDFAVVQASPEGYLQKIIEKPDASALASLTRPLGVSMNCWRFTPAIFQACRAIAPSPRGEWELPDAVQYSLAQQRYRVLWCREPVLDLSYRGDIAALALRLANRVVDL